MNHFLDAARALRALVEGSRHNRLLRLSFPRNDGPDALMVPNRLDAYEGLSRDFHFTVEVLSDNARLELKEVQDRRPGCNPSNNPSFTNRKILSLDAVAVGKKDVIPHPAE